jgi:hypothetical protein
MRTGLDVQEIRGRTRNQKEARVDMPLWFGHVVARIRNCAPVDAKPVLVEIRLKGGDDTKVRKLSGSRAAAMLARSAIRAETRFSNRKALFRDRNQTIKRTFFTLERRPDALRSLNRCEFTLNA